MNALVFVLGALGVAGVIWWVLGYLANSGLGLDSDSDSGSDSGRE